MNGEAYQHQSQNLDRLSVCIDEYHRERGSDQATYAQVVVRFKHSLLDFARKCSKKYK